MKSTPQGFTLDEALEILASTIESLLRVTPIRLRVDIAEDPEVPITLRLRELNGAARRSRIERQTEDDSGVVVSGNSPPKSRNGNRNPDFEPSEFQAKIYAALEYCALHGEALAAKIECDRRTLYKRNGIHEMIEAGWVHVDESAQQLGYFRPDCPPRQLREMADHN